MQLAARGQMLDALRLPRAAADAWRGEAVRVAGATIEVPGTRRVRLSVVAGDLRIHRLLDRFAFAGATVVDVGANIGYNTIHAARRVGPRGRVVAIEPAPDNLGVLRRDRSHRAGSRGQIVGADGIVKLMLANVFPGAAETMSARRMHKAQMERPPPAEDSPGAVRSPVRYGTGVSGGRRE